MVDPYFPSVSPDLPKTDFLGLAQGSCMLSYTLHYQLAYDPGLDGALPGIHTVQIRANRRGMRLFYRHGYLIVPPTEPENRLRNSAIPPTIFATARSSEESVNTTLQVGREATLVALGGNSFGSTTRSAVSLCGDVYEISEKTKRLPDFHRLSPIGTIYTDFLWVSRETDVIGMGFPDITTRREWVGLDYYGRIWITQPGTYRFQMLSDDGALLEIDGKRVIEHDGIHAATTGSGEVTLGEGPHTLHVPYFQGPRAAVLTLEVAAPGKGMTIFNTRSFTPPPSTPLGDR
jgi:hypothetical protein